MKTECGTAGEKRGLLAQPPMIIAYKANDRGGRLKQTSEKGSHQVCEAKPTKQPR